MKNHVITVLLFAALLLVAWFAIDAGVLSRDAASPMQIVATGLSTLNAQPRWACDVGPGICCVRDIAQIETPSGTVLLSSAPSCVAGLSAEQIDALVASAKKDAPAGAKETP